jgi:RNA polymerase sigma-70 factor (ECF subfamily)
MPNNLNDEAALIAALRAGDESVFAQWVGQYHPSLVRVARLFVGDETVAEELAQETWLAALRGLSSFEGRSSLKTWLFTILTNKAKTRGQREGRTVTFTDLENDPLLSQPTVDPVRFKDASAGSSSGHWAEHASPASWETVPETTLLAQETLHVIHTAIESLPENQRTVISLRDIHELSSEEVCNVLGISETNQRVLLHRARARVRAALETYLQPEP